MSSWYDEGTSTTLARSAPDGWTKDLRTSLTTTREAVERSAERERAFPDRVETLDNMVDDEEVSELSDNSAVPVKYAPFLRSVSGRLVTSAKRRAAPRRPRGPSPDPAPALSDKDPLPMRHPSVMARDIYSLAHGPQA